MKFSLTVSKVTIRLWPSIGARLLNGTAELIVLGLLLVRDETKKEV